MTFTITGFYQPAALDGIKTSMYVPKVADGTFQAAVNRNIFVMADGTFCEHCRLWDRAEMALRGIREVQKLATIEDGDIRIEYLRVAY
jgi:hypothetical protein